MTHPPAIFRILLIPAVLLSIWLCPCSQASKTANHSAAVKSCCEAKHAPSHDKARQDKDCPHCNGGPKVTADATKSTASIAIDFAFIAPLLFDNPVSLDTSVTLVSAFDLLLFADPPPIRLQTCTFLF